jgi:hypothetical protein
MHAKPGDHFVVRSTHVGEPDRGGEIVETRGPDGAPPYLVRWDATGKTGIFVPGAETQLQSTTARRPRKRS